MKTDKVATTSASVESENLQKLQSVFPNFVKDGQIDFDALKAFFDTEGLTSGSEKYGLSWAGKSRAFQAVRTPAIGTLIPQREESKNWDDTENLFIEGDNLEVLKLLQKHYRDKIKMIYIDPPYNTGKDFVYKDNFTQGVADYYEQTGQTQGGIKMSTNTEKNGRYHSDWLTMMYPRLFLARNLLKEDGVIFVSIDDNEVANLRLIMDEIFGEENFIELFSWQKTETPPNLSKLTKKSLEYILCYRKTDSRKNFLGLSKSSDSSNGLLNQTNAFKKLVFPANKVETGIQDGLIIKGEYGTSSYKINLLEDTEVKNGLFIKPVILEAKFKWAQENLDREISIGTIVSIRTKSLSPSYERADYAPEVPWNLINRDFGVGTNENASDELDQLFGITEIFDHPKPPSLIKYLANFLRDSKSGGDIFLDFFAGSGTTAHAVMDLNAEDEGNRKWICVQLPESTDEDSEAYKAGYKTIADISRERIRRVGAKIEKGDIGFKSYRLAPSNYRQWREITTEEDTETLLKQSKLFTEKPLVDNFEELDVVHEILLKEGFDLNTVVEEKKVISGALEYYRATDPETNQIIYISFSDKITQSAINDIGMGERATFVCFDNALDDTTKVNVGRNINIKTI